MNRFCNFLIFGVLFLVLEANAEEPEFSLDNKILTIPSVKVGDSYVYDAQLQLDETGRFAILGYSSQPSISLTCGSEHVNTEKSDLVTAGLSIDQVNKLIGCKGSLVLFSNEIGVYEYRGETLHPQIRVELENGQTVQSTYIP